MRAEGIVVLAITTALIWIVFILARDFVENAIITILTGTLALFFSAITYVSAERIPKK